MKTTIIVGFTTEQMRQLMAAHLLKLGYDVDLEIPDGLSGRKMAVAKEALTDEELTSAIRLHHSEGRSVTFIMSRPSYAHKMYLDVAAMGDHSAKDLKEFMSDYQKMVIRYPDPAVRREKALAHIALHFPASESVCTRWVVYRLT